MSRSARDVSFWALMPVLLASVSLGACGIGSSEDVVARVDGRPITKQQLKHRLSISGASGAPSDGVSLRKRAMESLITAEWTRAQASELGVSVSVAEAEQQLSFLDYTVRAGVDRARLFPREAELKQSLASKDLTHADRLSLVELNLLATKVEQKSYLLAEQQLTHAQLARYYRQNRRRFIVPEEREFMILLNGSKQLVLRSKREIEAGRGFLTLARRVSTYGEVPDGVQRLKRGEEEPEFVAHIFAAKLHALVGPIKQSAYYYIFELIKITPPRQRTLDEAEAMIRRLLMKRKSAQQRAESTVALARTWKARTSCDVGYVVPQCKEYVGSS